jgi:hypothetical protein
VDARRPGGSKLEAKDETQTPLVGFVVAFFFVVVVF